MGYFLKPPTSGPQGIEQMCSGWASGAWDGMGWEGRGHGARGAVQQWGASRCVPCSSLEPDLQGLKEKPSRMPPVIRAN